MNTTALTPAWQELSGLLSTPSLLAGLYGAFLGAVFASFLAVVAERVPRGESLGGRSHCVCGRMLKAGENIPVLGWLATGGRARCCGARLPVNYLLGEVIGFVLLGTVGLLSGLGPVLVLVALWVIVTIVVAFIRRKQVQR